MRSTASKRPIPISWQTRRLGRKREGDGLSAELCESVTRVADFSDATPILSCDGHGRIRLHRVQKGGEGGKDRLRRRRIEMLGFGSVCTMEPTLYPIGLQSSL